MAFIQIHCREYMVPITNSFSLPHLFSSLHIPSFLGSHLPIFLPTFPSPFLPSCATGARAFSFAFFGAGIGPIHLNNVRCFGAEQFLINCSFATPFFDNHFEDAGVRCAARELHAYILHAYPGGKIRVNEPVFVKIGAFTHA